jgi:uncharacterized protein with NAD-binding domain and iron-sulfur cluster
MARQSVVIVGAGIAGLSAAHELIERDFDVTVYERRFRCGGKAASVKVDDVIDKMVVPGEHGFRFFPGWYRHLPDTLSRIPSDRHKGHRGDNTVLDHLVTVSSNLITTYKGPPVPLLLHAPRNADQAQRLLSFGREIQKMGLTLEDAHVFLARLTEFLSVPDNVRKEKYDRIPWTEFLGGGRSAAFHVLASHTRTLVAAKPTEASAYTIATMAVRTLFDSSLTIDRVLDGPTSDVWIDPWVRFLEGRGVRFRYGYDLESVAFEDGAPRIASLRFSLIDSKYFSRANHEHKAPADERRRSLREFDEWRELRQPPGDLADPYREALAKEAAGDAKVRTENLKNLKTLGRQLLTAAIEHERKANDEQQRDSKQPHSNPFEPKADHYLFAVPIEQMAYYVNRSTMMTYHDPSLRNVVRLSSSVDWMVGIQFYLKSPLNLEAGHIVCADSEWSLTAIDQTQFWRDADVPKEVQSILSVDISAWDTKGHFNQKEAYRCTKKEITEEVWQQLKKSFNRSGKAILLDGMRLGAYLDENVAERYDRRKQAAYNRAQAVRFSAPERLAEPLDQDDVPFIYGERVELNVEPILINRPGSWALRPDPGCEKIENMFLAADYVATSTNLACMEGANEAARLAVNAILAQIGSPHDRCRIFDFADQNVLGTLATFVQLIEHTPGAQKSLELARSAASTLGNLATRAGENLFQRWKNR